MKLPGDLLEAYEDNSLIICVGPRLSTSAGLPSLADLARGLIECVDEDEWSSEDEPEQLRGWIEKRRTAEVLDQVRRVLGAEFEREVERRLNDNGREVPAIARSLASLRKKLRAIYTTRLDRLIERAFAGRWPSFSAPRPDFAQRRRMIFKLCGTLEFVQSWVLTSEQIERELLGRSSRRAVLETSFEAHRMLFIGFDPEDEELEMVLSAARAGQGEDQPEHFIVLSSIDRKERTALERRGLSVIRADTEDVLEALGAEEESEDSLLGGGCPYPGLDVFSEDMASVFFGRHAEISQATARFGDEDNNYWLSVEGQAGVGKSSFVLAGLLPALRNGFAAGLPDKWVVATMRPGSNPLEVLTQQVCAALGRLSTERLATDMLESPNALSETITKRTPKDHGFLLVIDQLEELVAFAPPQQRTLFGDTIARALELRSLYLITSMRSDFVPTLQDKIPALASLLNERADRYVLPPISRVGLREAITEPAALRGVMIEPALLERIVHDAETGDGTERSASGLPLIAHTLRGLWHASTSRGSLLGLSEYEAIGGVIGALGRSADRILASLDEDDRAAAKALLLQMVRVERDGSAGRRRLARDEALEVAGGSFDVPRKRGLFGRKAAKPKASGETDGKRAKERGARVLLALSGGAAERAAGVPSARLLTTVAADGQTLVELVHESLVRDWETLRVWIDENRRQLLLDDELRRRADKWNEHGRPTRGLPGGHELRELLEGRPSGESAELQDQYQAALHKAQLIRSASTVGAGVAITAASIVSAFVFMGKNALLETSRAQLQTQNETLDQQKQDLEQQQAELQAANTQLDEQAAELRLQSDTSSALVATMLADAPGRGLDAVAQGLEVYAKYIDQDTIPGIIEEGVYASTRRLHELRELGGHADAVIAVAYSRAEPRFASVDRSGTVKLWDGATYEEVGSFSDQREKLGAIAFSPDGQFLLTVNQSAVATKWQTSDGKRIGELSAPYDVTAIAISPTGVIATGGVDGEVSTWVGGLEERPLRDSGAGQVSIVTFSSDGAFVFAGDEGGDAASWSVDSGSARARVNHGGAIDSLSVSSDGQTFATSSERSEAIKLWSTSSGAASGVLDAQRGEMLQLVAFAPDAPRLLAVYKVADAPPILWDTDTSTPMAELEGHAGAVWAAAFSPNGEYLATAGDDGALRLWAPETGDLRGVLEGGRAQLRDVVFSHDSKRLVTADLSTVAPKVRVWEVEPGTHESLARIPEGATTHFVGLTPDGKRVAFVERGRGRVSVWEQGKIYAPVFEQDLSAFAVALSPDGTTLATGLNGEVALWDVESGTQRGEPLGGHQSTVVRIAYGSDGTMVSGDIAGTVLLSSGGGAKVLSGHEKMIMAISFAASGAFATASLDGLVTLWAADGKQLQQLPAGESIQTMALSADGGSVALATQTKILLFDAKGNQRAIDYEHTVKSMAFSPDGAKLAIGSSANVGGVISLVDVATLERSAIGRHDASVIDVRFSPDGKSVLAASKDGVATRWVTSVETRAAFACEALRHTSVYERLSSSCSALNQDK